MSQPTWTMKDGSVVAIAAMTDVHLMNTVRLLGRRALFLSRMAQRVGGRRIADGERENFALMYAFALEVKARGLHEAEPGTGAGGAVIRKDVFDVVEPCESCGDEGVIEPESGDPVLDRPYPCVDCSAGGRHRLTPGDTTPKLEA